MPPRKSKKTDSPSQPAKTLDSFFAVNRTRPAPLPLKTTTRSQTASSSHTAQETTLPTIVVVDLDSDSDDGLLDPLAILGPRTPRAQEDPVTPLTRSGLRPRTLPTTPAPRTPASATPYRNNLQSLVRAQECKKYDLGFLDEQMLLMSENDDDDDDSGSATNLNLLTDHDTQSVLPDILKEDAERIRAQIGADIDSERTPARLTLFNDDAHTHVAPVSNDERAGAFATTFDGNDPVERVFANTSANYNLHSILRHALKSDWIVVQAKLGWKLTQTIGDMLLRTMCLEPDR
ncbi:hypothetical protein GGI18_003958, partial [Coemansia linderi]